MDMRQYGRERCKEAMTQRVDNEGQREFDEKTASTRKGAEATRLRAPPHHTHLGRGPAVLEQVVLDISGPEMGKLKWGSMFTLF